MGFRITSYNVVQRRTTSYNVVQRRNGASPNLSILGIFVNTNFFVAAAPNMHRKKYRGARDLSDLKFSASYDTWRAKKHLKTKIMKIVKIAENVPGRRKLYLPGRGALRSRPSLSFPIEVSFVLGGKITDIVGNNFLGGGNLCGY